MCYYPPIDAGRRGLLEWFTGGVVAWPSTSKVFYGSSITWRVPSDDLDDELRQDVTHILEQSSNM
jgi:hypothetical protein